MTKVRTVNGSAYTPDGIICNKQITVRVTVDRIGKTLSLSDDKKIMLAVPLEGLEDLIVSGWEADP